MNTQSTAAKQPRDLTAEDMKLIRETFKDENVLKSMRAVLLGLPLTSEDVGLVRATFANPLVYSLVERRLCPSLDRDAPPGQIRDVWMGVEEMVFAQNPTTIQQALEYKRKAINAIRTALSLLKEPTSGAMDVSYDPTKDDELGTELLWRNQYIKHIETHISMLWVTANLPEEGGKKEGKPGTGINKNSAK